MGTIVCQTCEKTIGHFEDLKVSTLYGVCPNCNTSSHDRKEKREK